MGKDFLPALYFTRRTATKPNVPIPTDEVIKINWLQAAIGFGFKIMVSLELDDGKYKREK